VVTTVVSVAIRRAWPPVATDALVRGLLPTPLVITP
jgi:hypothetical protein